MKRDVPMTTEELLECWQRMYPDRPLSDFQKSRFLQHEDAKFIASFGPGLAIRALEHSPKLAEARQYIKSQLSGTPDPEKPVGTSQTSQPHRKTASGSQEANRQPVKRSKAPEPRRDASRPTAPLDADLHKMIGPTQRADDDF